MFIIQRGNQTLIASLLIIIIHGIISPTCSGAIYPCYAPPVVYGGTCQSDTAVFGNPETRVTYVINQINNVGTLICCQALGCGPHNSKICSKWGMYEIGCSTSSIDICLPWGSNVAKPAIKCKGAPSGTSIEWSH